MSYQISILLLTCSSLIFWSGPYIPGTYSNNYQEESLSGLVLTLNIKTQPTDQTDCKGNKSTFSVVTEGGTGKIHYLWKRKRPSDPAFIAFGAADSVKLAVYNIGVGNESPDCTLYQVSVTDAEVEITSTPALLTVNQITGISPVGVASYRLNQGENLWLKVLTSGNSPSGFQWIRKSGFSNWPDVKDGISILGSQDAQLNFTEISPCDSGIYKIRVTFPTINGNFCTETSAITRRIFVLAIPDTEPPTFIDLDNFKMKFCPDDLIEAAWGDSIAGIQPNKNNSCLFRKSDTLFDLSPANFSDNITPSVSLILHWGLFYDDILHLPVTDESGAPLDDRIGQISGHPESIKFEDKSLPNQLWQLIFWLEDVAGNLTPVSQRHIITIGLLRRPEIVSNF
ncbi:MAG: immunoglobulin domain-containing protein [Prolixibacteraceae bacterium]